MAKTTPTDFSSATSDIPGMLFVDHIAIAVPMGTLDQQVAGYELMGFREVHRETIEGRDQVRESLLRIGESPNLIQLLEPLNDDSPVQRALERQGGKGGLNHVGFRVKDIHSAVEHLRAKGFKMIDEAPRPGSRGTTVCFMHPKGQPEIPFNVLIELVEDNG